MSQHGVIKAIVFDFGGVISFNENHGPFKTICSILNVSREQFEEVYFKHNHLSNVENLPWKVVVLKVASVFNPGQEKLDQISTLLDSNEANQRINIDLLKIFPAIRRQGLKVAIFSNATSELREKLVSLGIAELVDEIVVSGEIGFQKPHKEAFDVLFETLGVKAEEVIFIDDSVKGLEESDEIGYIPILFKDNEKLIKVLKSLGINI